MMFQQEDPFSYLLTQKVMSGSSSNKNGNNIRLNLNKLPADFFIKPLPRKPNPLSQRVNNPQNQHNNQFLAYNQTIQLRRERKPSVFQRANSKILSLPKRQLTAEQRKRPEKRRMTQTREKDLQGFNCTFARKLYSESAQQKKRQLPFLQISRRQHKLKVENFL